MHACRAGRILALSTSLIACQATTPALVTAPVIPPEHDDPRPRAEPAQAPKVTSLESHVLDTAPADIPRLLDVNWENKIHLLGFGIDPPLAKPGQPVKLTFYWRCDEALDDQSWQLFTHLRDEDTGKTDNLDFDGPLRQLSSRYQVLGPGRWEKGKFYIDEQTYVLPLEIKGPVTVMVGIWRADARLRVITGPNDGDDRAIVTKIRVPATGGATAPAAVAARASPAAAPADVAAPPANAQRTASGLAYRTLVAGTGTVHPTAASLVTVNYTGWTPDGRMFDSSVARGQPARFRLTSVIKGWAEGVELMTKGEKARFWIPGNLAYGNAPRSGAPAGMLVFDIELIDIR